MFLWLSNENARDLLGASATITTVLQFLTGCLICQNYIRKKSTGEVSEKSYEQNSYLMTVPSRRALFRSQAVCYLARYGYAMEFS